MTFSKARSIFCTLFFSSMIMACTPVTREQSTNPVDIVSVNSTDNWSVFAEENPRECWAQTALGAQTLTVLSSPDESVDEQVVFAAGFPFSNTSLRIDGGRIFRLYNVGLGQNAWPKSPREDVQIVRALKSGSRAVVNARNARGERVRYVFSLSGAVEAITSAARLCSP